MFPSLRFVLQLVDPRGRFDRVDFIWAAITLMGAQLAFAFGLWITGASLMGWRGFVANVVFAWLGYCAISKRLHDLGHGNWWLLGRVLLWLAGATTAALVIALVGGPAALEMGTPAFWTTFAALMVPPLGLALWLHLARGEPAANPYGPAPAHASF
jgi:uncharacterized membrane protein YhaH (DUF805 family)